MTTSSVSDATPIRPNPDIVFGDVDGDIVALNMAAGSYLHLNSSGSFVFSLMDGPEPRTLEWLYARVRQQYDVDDVTCRQEVGEFVTRCVALDLFRVATADRG